MVYLRKDPELVILGPKVLDDVMHMCLPQPIHNLHMARGDLA